MTERAQSDSALGVLRRWAHETLVHRHGAEVFQTSTMSALLDGDVAIKDLLRHGDFGIGTFNGLDGEMRVLVGVCYQLRADGTAQVAASDQLTPFAVVTWFAVEHRIEVSARDRGAVKNLIDEEVASPNPIVAVRVTGNFSMVRTRTVTRQYSPYRAFTEATHDQKEVTFTDVSGALGGFRMPYYQQGISVAGYHSHFIDADRRHGGHALDYQLTRGTIEISTLSAMHLSLPRTKQFLSAELTNTDTDAQIRQTEGQ